MLCTGVKIRQYLTCRKCQSQKMLGLLFSRWHIRPCCSSPWVGTLMGYWFGGFRLAYSYPIGVKRRGSTSRWNLRWPMTQYQNIFFWQEIISSIRVKGLTRVSCIYWEASYNLFMLWSFPSFYYKTICMAITGDVRPLQKNGTLSRPSIIITILISEALEASNYVE